MNKWSETLEHFGNPPKGILDQVICDRLLALAKAPEAKASDIHDILDDIVHGGMAADLVVSLLDVLWGQMLADEGSSREAALVAKHGRYSDHVLVKAIENGDNQLVKIIEAGAAARAAEQDGGQHDTSH